jgi:8-oxo-dGTP pyrophosphatase MutT (NUDIX family)
MKAQKHNRLLALVLCAANAACAQQAPECQIAVATVDQRVGNAGCLIAVDGRTLLIAHSISGKLGFPGGTSRAGESAQCTAHRETWEETGIDVEVGAFLKQLSTGFLLYACHAGSGELSPDEIPHLPAWSLTEVSGFVWRDLDSVEAAEWRFPDQVEEVRGLDDPD